MELAAWRRDHQSEWSLETRMNLDGDPQAWSTAFKSWIDGIKATHVEDVVGTTSSKQENTETNHKMMQRIPGAFPAQ